MAEWLLKTKRNILFTMYKCHVSFMIISWFFTQFPRAWAYNICAIRLTEHLLDNLCALWFYEEHWLNLKYFNRTHKLRSLERNILILTPIHTKEQPLSVHAKHVQRFFLLPKYKVSIAAFSSLYYMRAVG